MNLTDTTKIYFDRYQWKAIFDSVYIKHPGDARNQYDEGYEGIQRTTMDEGGSIQEHIRILHRFFYTCFTFEAFKCVEKNDLETIWSGGMTDFLVELEFKNEADAIIFKFTYQ